MTPEEEIKINNFKEQYNSIKKNIEIANTELEHSHARTKGAEETLASLGFKVEDAVAQLDMLHGQAAVIHQNIAHDLNELTRRERELDEREKIFFSQKADEEEKLQKTITQLSSQIALIQDEIKKLNDLKKEVSEDYALALGKTQLAYEQFEKVEDAIQILHDQHLDLQTKHDHLVKLANEEIKAKQVELTSVEKKIAEEVEKVRSPKESLVKEIQEFERKKDNLEVMYRRTKYAFEQIYPNQDLDTLIK